MVFSEFLTGFLEGFGGTQEVIEWFGTGYVSMFINKWPPEGLERGPFNEKPLDCFRPTWVCLR